MPVWFASVGTTLQQQLSDGIPQLVSALCPILIVNGIPRCTSLDGDALDALDLALRADYACWCLCLTNNELLPTGMSIVSAALSFSDHDASSCASSLSLDKKTANSLSTRFSDIQIASTCSIKRNMLSSFSRCLLEGLRFTEWHRIYPRGDDIVTESPVLPYLRLFGVLL